MDISEQLRISAWLSAILVWRKKIHIGIPLGGSV